MATLRNKRKLAAVTRATQEEHSRNGQSRNTSVPRINEEYITQLSEELEGRVTKKLSQELSRTESRILGALSKLDEFLSNQQIQTHSKTVPGTFRNTNVENQGTNEASSAARLLKTLARKWVLTWWQELQNRHATVITWWQELQERFAMAMTWWQQFKKKFLLLLWNFLRKTKEGALHKSATISQWGHPRDTWGTPDFVGPSAIGDELQFSQFQQQY